MFRSTDMVAQKKNLMQTLTVVVRSLEHLEQLVPAVQALGRRHGGYGVRPAHYDTVGGALLWTLGQGLGDAFTPEVSEAWAEDILDPRDRDDRRRRSRRTVGGRGRLNAGAIIAPRPPLQSLPSGNQPGPVR